MRRADQLRGEERFTPWTATSGEHTREQPGEQERERENQAREENCASPKPFFIMPSRE